MILMLDNYDSFTYNIVQYLAELGAQVRVVRNDDFTADQLLQLKPDGIVLSPGPGRPEQAGVMNDLIRLGAGHVPLFGVCLGMQGMAQVAGGRIVHAPSLMHGKVSQITHAGTSLFEQVPNPFQATRYHSLVVERNSLPEAFIVTAETSDGLVMAISHRHVPMQGVQFHPESILTTSGKQILANMLTWMRQ